VPIALGLAGGYALVPLSVALVFLTGWSFWRSLESGQFDDLERPAHDIMGRRRSLTLSRARVVRQSR